MQNIVTDLETTEYISSHFPNHVSKNGYKHNLIDFITFFVNRPIHTKQLKRIPGKTELQTQQDRRIREVRDQDGYEFYNNKNTEMKEKFNLENNYWILLSTEKKFNFTRTVSKKIYNTVFTRDNFTCCTCGAIAGQPHPNFSSETTSLNLGHSFPFSKEDKNKIFTETDFKTLCSKCNQGESNTIITNEDKIEMYKKQIDYCNTRINELSIS
jgi:5-methylcytosine-specific restriction endonuclease McrA